MTDADESATRRIAEAPDTITERLCAELRARAERGLQKYGVSLDGAPLTAREVLQHAKEEALDLAAYLERLIDLEDRIASAPKAWARVTEDGGLHVIGLESFTREQAQSFADGYGIKLVPVALVELVERKP